MTTSTESTLLDVGPTAEQISKMARILRERATELDNLAERMREKKNFEYAAEAINVVANIVPELRLDLLVARPVRVLDAVVRKFDVE